MARAYLAISVVTVLWAGNFTAAKIGVGELDPWFISSFRIIVTGVVFWLLLPPEHRAIKASDWKAILPLSLTGISVNHLCFAAGMRITTPSHSAVIHALIPVVVALVAWFMLGERLSPLGILGMAVAVGGALVVVLGAPREELRGQMLGDLITAVGIVSFSYYTVQGRRVLRSMDSVRAVALGFLFASPFMVPVIAWSAWHQPWGAVTWKGWAALAYMQVCASLICYRLHIYALQHLTAGRVAAFTTLQPAIGILVALAAGVDRATASLAAGAALALAGVVLVQIRGGVGSPRSEVRSPVPPSSPPGGAAGGRDFGPRTSDSGLD
jgi:drug/metabolite transporter (DMT)-like permease